MILKAVSGIDFELYKGQTFALVGESGCGKSTVANLVVGLHRPTAGKIEFDGTGWSSGVYYYKIISGNYSETKKMVLLK